MQFAASLSAASDHADLMKFNLPARQLPRYITRNKAWPRGHALNIAKGQKSAFVILVTLPTRFSMLFAGATLGATLATVLITALIALATAAALAALTALTALVASLTTLALTLIPAFFVLALVPSGWTALGATLPALAALWLTTLAALVAALTTLIT